MPTRHRSKHINFQEMFAILHTFLLWHEPWSNDRVHIASDSGVVVDAINKHSIKGPAIRPLQSILLIAAVFNIDLMAFWIPSEENIVADAASRFDFKKLAELGFQMSSPDHPNPSMSSLHQKLRSFFTSPKVTSTQSTPFISNTISLPKCSVIPTSTFSSMVGNVSMVTNKRESGFLSQRQSSSK